MISADMIDKIIAGDVEFDAYEGGAFPEEYYRLAETPTTVNRKRSKYVPEGRTYLEINLDILSELASELDVTQHGCIVYLLAHLNEDGYAEFRGTEEDLVSRISKAVLTDDEDAAGVLYTIGDSDMFKIYEDGESRRERTVVMVSPDLAVVKKPYFREPPGYLRKPGTIRFAANEFRAMCKCLDNKIVFRYFLQLMMYMHPEFHVLCVNPDEPNPGKVKVIGVDDLLSRMYVEKEDVSDLLEGMFTSEFLDAEGNRRYWPFSVADRRVPLIPPGGVIVNPVLFGTVDQSYANYLQCAFLISSACSGRRKVKSRGGRRAASADTQSIIESVKEGNEAAIKKRIVEYSAAIEAASKIPPFLVGRSVWLNLDLFRNAMCCINPLYYDEVIYAILTADNMGRVGASMDDAVRLNYDDSPLINIFKKSGFGVWKPHKHDECSDYNKTSRKIGYIQIDRNIASFKTPDRDFYRAAHSENPQIVKIPMEKLYEIVPDRWAGDSYGLATNLGSYRQLPLTAGNFTNYLAALAVEDK